MRNKAREHIRKLKFTSPIKFPLDEGSHNQTTDEWWYFNCHLVSEDDRSYSAVVCFFPTYLLSMLVDVSNKKMLHNSVKVNESFHSSNQRLDVTFGRSWWKQAVESPSIYVMHCDVGDFVADLRMEVLKQPLLVNGNGQIKEGLLGRSYYYAHTRLRVEGSIKVNGEEIKVNGMGWIDRQWGEWDWSGIGMWEWFSIQLSNNVEMLLIQIIHPLTSDIVSRSLTVSDEQGKTKVFDNFFVRERGTWKSPDSNEIYESGWTINSPGKCELHVLPIFNAQESMRGLWEGACEVHGSFEGREVRGRAYVEESHGRIYGRKRKKFIALTIGLVKYNVRKIFPIGLNFSSG